jgi:hypothetical protein
MSLQVAGGAACRMRFECIPAITSDAGRTPVIQGWLAIILSNATRLGSADTVLTHQLFWKLTFNATENASKKIIHSVSKRANEVISNPCHWHDFPRSPRTHL